MQEMDLYRHTDTVNELLARYGVKFGIYKNNEFKEQLFPFDAIPRVIEAEEFTYLEKGLKQRVMALNLFIKDIYSEKKNHPGQDRAGRVYLCVKRVSGAM